jgi:O-antigen/teichoic acid export membrane protein
MTANGPAPRVGDDGSLRSRAARGSAVTLATQLIRALVLLGGTIILARLVAPSDFGLIAMVLAVSGIAEILRDSGLSISALRRPDLTQQQRSNLFWLNTAIGLGLSVAVFCLSWPLAAFYGQSILVEVMQWIAPIYFVNGIAAQFRIAINQRLQFGILAVIDIVPPVLALGVAIGVATAGQGLAALVIQQVVAPVLALALAVGLARWWPGLPRRTPGMKELVVVGWNFAATQVLSYATRNIDSIAIGRVHGPRALGYYDQAYQLAVAPLILINSPITRVAVPVLARVREDRRRYVASLREAQLIACYVTASVLLVVAGVGTPLVTVVLGPTWSAAGPILSVLALGSVFRSIQQIANWIFVTEGITRSQLGLYLVGQPIIVTLVLVGVLWGPIGVAAGGAVGWALFWLLSLIWVGRAADLDVRPLILDPLRIIGLVGLPAGLAAFCVVTFVPLDPVWTLLIGLAAALICYATAVLVSRRVRTDVRTLLSFVRLAVAGRRGAGADNADPTADPGSVRSE